MSSRNTLNHGMDNATTIGAAELAGQRWDVHGNANARFDKFPNWR